MPSFSEALEYRYAEDSDSSSPCEIYLVGSYPGRASPTSGRLVLPRTLTLNRYGMNCAGQQRKIRELCQNVEELDLAQNELSDLIEIDNMLRHMPKISFLNLSHNNLQEATPEPLTQSVNLLSLVLNHTHVSWDIVGCFLNSMPNIEELHLSLNEYSSVGLSENQCYPNLRELYLCGNPLSSWEDVVLVGKIFPKLESLVMADTRISTVSDPQEWENQFQSLKTLNLNNALFNDWRDIDRLNAFPKLVNVRLMNIPLLNDLKDLERRQHLIAYLPCVVRLNGSNISQKEREDAERAFIRHWLRSEHRPRRFYELESIHGKLDPLVDVDLSPKKTAQLYVNFCEQQSLLTLDLQQSVQELKHSLSDKFGLKPQKIRLFYLDQDLKEVHGPEELRFNNRKLYSYRMRDGDELLVDTK